MKGGIGGWRANERAAKHGRESAAEKRLVARFQAGDGDALETLFELHVDAIFAYARQRLGNREDAEEVTSEAFLRAFERIATFRGESVRFAGGCIGIARNLCFDRLRQPRLLLLEPEEAERHSDEGRAAAQMETSALTRQAMNGLSDEHRLVLTLCDVEEWEAREVAAMLEKTLPATKSLLYRARRALRDRLTELWNEEEEEGEEA